MKSTNPITGATVWDGAAASSEAVKGAVAAAREAFHNFSMTPLSERIAMMERWGEAILARKEQIARAISDEIGKPMWEARTEAGAMAGKVAHSIRAQAERAGSTASDAMSLNHRPHGVMAVFGPFNFPGHLPNGHIIPALLAGNTVVFKPSELAPSVGDIFADLAREAGLADGVLNIVQGGRDTGAALLNADIDGLLFTGSAGTGTFFHKHFAGRPNVILALEMGGNNPLIIHDAADIDAAADIATVSAFISAGQRCSCARRLILPTGAFGDAVLDRIMVRIAAMAVGAPDEDVFIGSVVSEDAAKAAIQFEADLMSKGGQTLVALERNGAFLRPGLMDVTQANAPDEEIFAPFLQVYRTDGIEAQIALANDTRFGLAAGLVSDDAALWDHARPRLRAGIVNWNKPTTGAASSMPFGGPGLSGNFRPGAYYAADYCAWPQASQIAAVPTSPALPNF
ncbi:N-succinylglutamate 5-semialdehyde dehydrogenase [Algimonas ampicilliniresistens]|uniref:N-succinylglutamate 5-semialdehyde dehydrogenase n=1 Tax=Algimonas ampicilliniresistens TaxID=1298735 RepID=A0ABQ5VD23_9PROT|nr:succinylglutamate-semialdehyde dehydrogenase [Algimonas ampicilliniresistens]GLQ24486.1 N-succinylglutamate 5-semialdehyde dehydrogenase [Algimonas ampicilliniresistens]